MHSFEFSSCKMSEKFSIKWNDFHSNVSKSFEVLRNGEYLQDVTLVGDDDHQVRAHKLVLSACSSYFKKIFTKNIQSNILLCLEGTTQKDLQNMLDYMYNGEVQIFQEELDRFLTFAQRMKLEGLIKVPEGPKIVTNESEVMNSFADQKLFNPRETMRNLKTERTLMRDLSTFEDKITIQMSTDDMNEINEKINQSFEKLSNGLFKCLLCGKITKQCGGMKQHVETHLEGLSYPCQHCGKIYRLKESLRKHTFQIHK